MGIKDPARCLVGAHELVVALEVVVHDGGLDRELVGLVMGACGRTVGAQVLGSLEARVGSLVLGSMMVHRGGEGSYHALRHPSRQKLPCRNTHLDS